MDVEQPSKKKLKYPKSVFFIVTNEFCERFSFYGMRTILVLFLKDILALSENLSTVVFHIFVMFCYFFPVLGGIIADTWLGKFKTILYISIIYAIGNVVVSFAAITTWGLPSREMTYIGLLLIALGTGGIKPCVSAFGGDQFVLPQQEKQLAAFFSVFYFAINSGSLVSTFLTPELRQNVRCFDESTCYPVAFGVPAILMVVSIIIFVLGKPGYIIKTPEGNVLLEVCKCIGSAISNKIKSKGEVKEHWLDYADSRFDSKLRSDTKSTLRVLLLFVPLPFFWALFDQQGSRWTFQAANMNGRIGSYIIKPDQMQVVNPFLILLFLPLCQTVIYPLCAKCNFLTRPLQKLVTGGMLAAVAFLISGFLELQLEPGYPVLPSAGFAQVRIFNGLANEVEIGGASFGSSKIGSLDVWTQNKIEGSGNRTIELYAAGDGINNTIKIETFDGLAVSYHLFKKGNVISVSRGAFDDIVKSVNPDLMIMYRFEDSGKHTVTLNGPDKKAVEIQGSGTYHFKPSSVDSMINPGEYTISLDNTKLTTKELDIGGNYYLFIDNSRAKLQTIVEPNTMHMLWLVPQYVILTLGEVMFSVTGLEFAFTQAPLSMKSVLTSAWLLTVAFGNAIVVIIAGAAIFESHASEFFLFAGLMFLDMIIFIFLTLSYQYVSVDSEEQENGHDMRTFSPSNGSTEKKNNN